MNFSGAPPISPAARSPIGTPSSPSRNTNNIQVSVRCRPLSEPEARRSQHISATCNSARRTVAVIHPTSSKKADRSFAFDSVFGAYAKQEEVFDRIVAPWVQDSIAGYHCAFFAYGPPGSGKTYTVIGDLHDAEQWGMAPRAAERLFRHLCLQSADFTVKLSYLEIHNEELRDLLSLHPPSTSSTSSPGVASLSGKKLRLVEDQTRGIICQNQEEFVVHGMEETVALLSRGAANRTHSSHGVVCFSVVMTENRGAGEEVVSVGQLRFVDLAGVENIEHTYAREQAREAGSINQSLLTLGRVITALVDHHSHVPYRDSRLTRLMQESFGGKAKACVIATICPALGCVDETLAALEYAFRAKGVQNRPSAYTTSRERYTLQVRIVLNPLHIIVLNTLLCTY
ncbi:P-loop containing nucleoside triphosphate hydrolase protein [Ochromonadaceae sp. CCMP2298]|nr:P-loop containing nucleoside triphosphate hydrolase protein [Ochromonadaceae sp. CCMP2298]